MNYTNAPDQIDIMQITAGDYHNLVLTSNGQIYTWGANSQGQLGHGTNQKVTRPKLVTADNALNHTFIQVAGGKSHSLAVTENGEVYACGYNKNGQLGLPDQKIRTSFTKVLSLQTVSVSNVFAGGAHSWALLDQNFPKRNASDYEESKTEDDLSQTGTEWVLSKDNTQMAAGVRIPPLLVQVNYSDT